MRMIHRPYSCPSQAAVHKHSARASPRVERRRKSRPLDMYRHRCDYEGGVDGERDYASQVARTHHLQVQSLHQTMTPRRMTHRMHEVCDICSILCVGISKYHSCHDMMVDVLLLFFRPAPSLSTVSSVHITRRPCCSPPRRWRDPMGPEFEGPLMGPVSSSSRG